MITKTENESIIRRTGKIATSALLVAGLMLAPKPAKADSLELASSTKSATIDIKASADLTKKLGVFIRARPSQDFKTGNINSFGLVDMTVNLRSNVDAVGELQFISGSTVPRAGVQGYTGLGDVNLYCITTVGLNTKPYVEVLTKLGYTPRISNNIKLLAQIEDVSDISRNGHLWSTQRLRLGLNLDTWGFGAATDLTEVGNKPKSADGSFSYAPGAFVLKTF
ncbi:MAG: hypothetical protein Q7S22_03625 [Candidatus Micrarchaeota archaeon]|nr:hypothetical protein [Candidatus Micrarchaeota archaeon]